MGWWGSIGAAIVALAVTASLSAAPAAADEGPARYDKPFQGFASASTTLRDSSPQAAGLDPSPISDALGKIAGWTQGSADQHPLYAGAVTLMGHDGQVVTRTATGYALRYADGSGSELPRDQWIPTRDTTIFDMASVSKLFTSIVVVQQVERGAIRLDEPVATYLPAFAAHGKQAITVRQLLTHTSGLKPWMPLWSGWPDRESRIAAVLDVEPTSPPGTTYVYSDLNLITLGVLVERMTGRPLDELVRTGITAPLGMTDTGYNPDRSLRPRIAATEYQSSPARGMVWGEVHDENAWSLGGVAGHAGIFSTAQDLAVLAQTMLNGGSYAGHRILTRESVQSMITDNNAAFPGHAHGLGFELDQRWYMSGLSSPTTAGHTGYTGTSLVIDFMSRSFVVLLANRVHPSRSWGSNNPARRVASQALALALAVEPREGKTAWFSGTRDGSSATLTTTVIAVPDKAAVTFDLFVDTESSDPMTLEASTDGGATFHLVPFSVRDRGKTSQTDGTIATSGSRRWIEARAELAAGPQILRWRYTTDSLYLGRGVYVDDIRVSGKGGTVLDGERQPEAFTAQGWSQASR